jgi:hypothetical protein
MTTAEAKTIFLAYYNELALEISNQFIAELEEQGHRATGKLIASVVVMVQNRMDEYELALSHLAYGVTVNTGLKASEVPRTIKFIQELAAWIKVKGIAGGLDKTIEKIAIRMAKVMWKVGIPTPGSYRFTSNGRRTMWIDFVYNKYNVGWQDRVGVIASDYMENVFDAMLIKTCNQFKPYLEFSKN